MMDNKEAEEMLKKMDEESRVRLHNAFIRIADIDVEYLSYKGQTVWNKLAEIEGKKQ